MRHLSLRLLLALGLVVPAHPASTQEKGSDPEVARGVQQVEEGDYDAALVTLDAAARRLAPDPARGADVSRAYLYLGVAHVGKGDEAAARARFRDAVQRQRDMTLDPDQFPPKVIDLFEAARREALAAAPAPSAPPPAPAATRPATSGGGGGGKTLLIVGGLVLAGGGAALALGGDGGTQQRPPLTFMGVVAGDLPPSDHTFSVGAPGTLAATVTWISSGGDRPAVVNLELKDANFDLVAVSTGTGPTEARLSANVSAGTHTLRVVHAESCNGCTATFTLRVQLP